MSMDALSEREVRVLEAVIQVYIETAEPAGSQTIVQHRRCRAIDLRRVHGSPYLRAEYGVKQQGYTVV